MQGLLDNLDARYSKKGKGIVGFGNPKHLLLLTVIQVACMVFLLLLGLHAWHSCKSVYPGDYAFLTDNENYKIQLFQLAHFFYYFVLALMFPDAWFFIWLTSFGWEILEYALGWAVWSDLAFNTAGIASGVILREMIERIDGRPTAPIIAVLDRHSIDKSDKRSRIAIAVIMAFSVIGVSVAMSTGGASRGWDKIQNNFYDRFISRSGNKVLCEIASGASSTSLTPKEEDTATESNI